MYLLRAYLDRCMKGFKNDRLGCLSAVPAYGIVIVALGLCWSVASLPCPHVTTLPEASYVVRGIEYSLGQSVELVVDADNTSVVYANASQSAILDTTTLDPDVERLLLEPSGVEVPVIELPEYETVFFLRSTVFNYTRGRVSIQYTPSGLYYDLSSLVVGLPSNDTELYFSIPSLGDMRIPASVENPLFAGREYTLFGSYLLSSSETIANLCFSGTDSILGREVELRSVNASSVDEVIATGVFGMTDDTGSVEQLPPPTNRASVTFYESVELTETDARSMVVGWSNATSFPNGTVHLEGEIVINPAELFSLTGQTDLEMGVYVSASGAVLVQDGSTIVYSIDSDSDTRLGQFTVSIAGEEGSDAMTVAFYVAVDGGIVSGLTELMARNTYIREESQERVAGIGVWEHRQNVTVQVDSDPDTPGSTEPSDPDIAEDIDAVWSAVADILGSTPSIGARVVPVDGSSSMACHIGFIYNDSVGVLSAGISCSGLQSGAAHGAYLLSALNSTSADIEQALSDAIIFDPSGHANFTSYPPYYAEDRSTFLENLAASPGLFENYTYGVLGDIEADGSGDVESIYYYAFPLRLDSLRSLVGRPMVLSSRRVSIDDLSPSDIVAFGVVERISGSVISGTAVEYYGIHGISSTETVSLLGTSNGYGKVWTGDGGVNLFLHLEGLIPNTETRVVVNSSVVATEITTSLGVVDSIFVDQIPVDVLDVVGMSVVVEQGQDTEFEVVTSGAFARVFSSGTGGTCASFGNCFECVSSIESDSCLWCSSSNMCMNNTLAASCDLDYIVLETSECSTSEIHNCSVDNGGCDQICTQTSPSTVVCSCESGYDSLGNHCLDIDECTLGLDNCAPQATCTNTVGSFTCTCNAFYEGNGVVCSDINECEEDDNGGCSEQCVNRIGEAPLCQQCEAPLYGERCLVSAVQVTDGQTNATVPVLLNPFASSPSEVVIDIPNLGTGSVLTVGGVDTADFARAVENPPSGGLFGGSTFEISLFDSSSRAQRTNVVLTTPMLITIPRASLLSIGSNQHFYINLWDDDTSSWVDPTSFCPTSGRTNKADISGANVSFYTCHLSTFAVFVATSDDSDIFAGTSLYVIIGMGVVILVLAAGSIGFVLERRRRSLARSSRMREYLSSPPNSQRTLIRMSAPVAEQQYQQHGQKGKYKVPPPPPRANERPLPRPVQPTVATPPPQRPSTASQPARSVSPSSQRLLPRSMDVERPVVSPRPMQRRMDVETAPLRSVHPGSQPDGMSTHTDDFEMEPRPLPNTPFSPVSPSTDYIDRVSRHNQMMSGQLRMPSNRYQSQPSQLQTSASMSTISPTRNPAPLRPVSIRSQSSLPTQPSPNRGASQQRLGHTGRPASDLLPRQADMPYRRAARR